MKSTLRGVHRPARRTLTQQSKDEEERLMAAGWEFNCGSVWGLHVCHMCVCVCLLESKTVVSIVCCVHEPVSMSRCSRVFKTRGEFFLSCLFT